MSISQQTAAKLRDDPKEILYLSFGNDPKENSKKNEVAQSGSQTLENTQVRVAGTTLNFSPWVVCDTVFNNLFLGLSVFTPIEKLGLILTQRLQKVIESDTFERSVKTSF